MIRYSTYLSVLSILIILLGCNISTYERDVFVVCLSEDSAEVIVKANLRIKFNDEVYMEKLKVLLLRGYY